MSETLTKAGPQTVRGAARKRPYWTWRRIALVAYSDRRRIQEGVLSEFLPACH